MVFMESKESERARKLKTLKDLEDDWREFFKYIWQLSPHNFERKIQKGQPDDIVKGFIDYKLKAEAVKWVKDMQDKKHYMCADYFKHFFNLTEEDLEEKQK